jgi:hypothetical protein
MANENSKKFDVPPPEGWEEGKRMPGPPPKKPDWYELTQGPCPDDRKPFFNVVKA